jgi:hypothetical protein
VYLLKSGSWSEPIAIFTASATNEDRNLFRQQKRRRLEREKVVANAHI